MKRDLDLIRKILQSMERNEHGFTNESPTIDGYTEEQIGYHAFLLNEAGLIKAVERTNLGSLSPEAIPLNLTWKGHEFIDAAKDDGIWNKAKSVVLKPAGGVAFDVLLDWLKSEAKQRLGLP